jgi:glycosyltransferase involved in cell wall biosynthesis
MKKLIIQVPCYNEESTIARTLEELPRKMEGFSCVEWLIIDDGCTDNTVAVALEKGVDHVIRFKRNKGLAKGFMAGINECLQQKADVIVNTDADNQYCARDIAKLVQPILDNKADIVVGARPIREIKHFSKLKKLLQLLGSRVVRMVSKTRVDDATSGFRAISREAALKMNVFNEYTYTLETIIQAGQKNMDVVSIPITTNADERPSRLVKSIFSYLRKSVATIVRIFVVYKPFRFFLSIGLTFFLCGFFIGLRYLFFYLTGSGKGHVQSLVLSSILLSIGFQVIITAFVADLLSVNRRLIENVQYLLKKISLSEDDSNKQT